MNFLLRRRMAEFIPIFPSPSDKWIKWQKSGTLEKFNIPSIWWPSPIYFRMGWTLDFVSNNPTDILFEFWTEIKLISPKCVHFYINSRIFLVPNTDCWTWRERSHKRARNQSFVRIFVFYEIFLYNSFFFQFGERAFDGID